MQLCKQRLNIIPLCINIIDNMKILLRNNKDRNRINTYKNISSNVECVVPLRKEAWSSNQRFVYYNTNEFSLFTLSYSCEMTTINTWTVTGLNIY